MQMKNRKRFLALAAAAAMVIAPCSAFASNVTSSAISGMGGIGTGSHEGWVDKEYFKVEYPTVADGELDFILDPQGLIAANKTANGSTQHYGSDTFEDNQTVFFKAGSTKTWTHFSKTYEVKTWSTSTVEISVQATVSCDAITLATDSAFDAEDTTASIYMAVVKGDGTIGTFAAGTVADPSTKVATMNVTQAALDASNFEIKDDGNGYEYVLKGTPAGESLKFHLEGAANPNGEWKNYVDIKPSVDLVWSVAPQSGAQVVSATGDPLKWANRAQDYSFKVDLSAAGATAIKDVGVSYNGKVHTYNGTWTGGTKSLQVQGWAEISGDTVTLKPGLSQYLPAGDKLYVKLETASGDKVIQLIAE